MQTKIDFDKATNRFLIWTPMWMLDKVRGIPNRRFQEGRKVWTAPAIRMNVAYLREKFPYTQAEWTPAAKQAAESATKPPPMRLIPFPLDYQFKTKPMPKQIEALNMAWSVSTPALFMAMGSGKTKVAIDLHSARFNKGQIDAVIVICPVSIKRTWVSEIQKHSPIPVQVTTLDMDRKDGGTVHISQNGGLRWFIVGIESIQGSKKAQDLAKKIAASFRCAAVVDESSKIKNPQAIRARQCCEIGKACTYRTIMTGTPVTQGIIDLFMQFEFLDPQIIGIGDWFSFRNRYAVMGGFENKQIIGYQNVDELISVIRPFVFQVTKEEALPDLPPKVYTPTRSIKMTEEQRKIYKEIKLQLSAVVNGREVSAKNVLDKMRLLQQVECGFYSAGEENEFDGEISRVERLIPGQDPKITEMMNVLDETNEPTIIWCRYRNQLARVVEALCSKYGQEAIVEFHGGCDENRREESRLRFQGEHPTKPPARFIVATQSAGGMGQTWTRATLVIYMSNTFSLEDREQSEDRPHRIGQHNAVTYIDIACEATVGVHVIEVVRNKKDFATFIKECLKNNREDVLNVA